MAVNTRAVILTGDKELDAALASMPRLLQNKGIRVATNKAAKIVLAGAKRWAKEHKKSGEMFRALTVRKAREGAHGKKLPRGSHGHAVTTREGHLFRSKAFYAGILEFGWEHRPEGFSWLRGALYDNKAQVRKAFMEELPRALEDAANQARQRALSGKSYKVTP